MACKYEIMSNNQLRKDFFKYCKMLNVLIDY